jgi:hypothetical protein
VSRLRLVRPPVRQLTLDELTFVPRPAVLVLVEEALPLARQLELMAGAMGPESERVARELVDLLASQAPMRPRRAA